MEEKQKRSIFKKIFSLIGYIFIFLFPSVKLISLNKFLNKGYKIEKDKWFLKQKQRNLVLSIIFLIPLFLTFYKSYNIIENDTNISSRMDLLDKKSNGFIDKITSYDDLIVIKQSDSLILKEAKFESQARFLASGIVLSFGLLFQLILAILITKFHPLITDTKKLKKLLIGQVINKENENKAIIFATPIGFLIDITGMSPEDVVSQRSIWDALNLTVKDFSRDPSQRSLVFFRKEFELQNVYMYDKL